MWMIFGGIAIVTAVLNLVWMHSGKDPVYFRFVSIAATALTACAFYSLDAEFVKAQDWGALMDIAPTASLMLWGCVIAAILLNGISLVKKRMGK